MPRLRWWFAALVWLAPAVAARAETPDDPQEVIRVLFDEIDRNSRLAENLEYVCDMIGPRLTGSAKLNQASQWTLSKLAEYGLANPHLEPWTIARGWGRVRASGRVTSPTEQRLELESAGWSPSTHGPIRGPVVYPKGDDPADVEAYRGKLRGAWIIEEPVSIHIPAHRVGHPTSAHDDEEPEETPGYLAFRKAFDDLAAAEGPAGYLRDSDKEHGLLRMASASDDFHPAAYPEALLTTESYGLIWRLLRRGPAEVEIDLKNEFSAGPVEVQNVVAELPGVELPDEVVILGGHLDSWDLGTGATDNATGCMAIVEAARALKAAGVRPRRTIRFVLFAGEEQGRHGSRAYVQAHASELGKVSAVLIQDMGTGRVRTLALQGRYDLRQTMDRVVAPFADELGLEELSLRRTGGTDHLSFQPYGVPAFAVRQHLDDYFKTHHTESDTFDKIDLEAVGQSAKVLAAWAYNVANLPELLPRDPGLKRNLASHPGPMAPARPTPMPMPADGKPNGF